MYTIVEYGKIEGGKSGGHVAVCWQMSELRRMSCPRSVKKEKQF